MGLPYEQYVQHHFQKIRFPRYGFIWCIKSILSTIPNIFTFSGTDFYRPGAKNQSVQLDFNLGFVWKLNINC